MIGELKREKILVDIISGYAVKVFWKLPVL